MRVKVFLSPFNKGLFCPQNSPETLNMIAVESLHSPYGDADHLNISNEQERKIKAKFGEPLTTIAAIEPESPFKPNVKGPTLVTVPQILEATRNLKTKKTAKELFGPKIEDLTNIPQERSEREKVMQSVTLIPSSPVKTESISTPLIIPTIEQPKPQPSKEGAKLPKSWQELITGFSPLEEVDALKRNYNEARLHGLSHEEAFNQVWKKHESNLIKYHMEYTMTLPVLINNVGLNEKGHLVNSKTGERLADITSADERDGAVKQSVIKTEKMLAEAEEGEMVWIISPAGYSGRFDDEGNAINYKEPELFGFKKLKEGKVQAFTLIADLSYGQCVQIHDVYAASDPNISNMKLSERHRIKSMVSEPIHVKDKNSDFKGFLKVVQGVKGDSVMREANGSNQTFIKAFELLDMEDDLKLLPERCEVSREMYKNWLGSNISNINSEGITDIVMQSMIICLLEDISIIQAKTPEEQNKRSNLYERRFISNDNKSINLSTVMQNYQAQIAFIQTKLAGLGCNIGGSGSGSGALGQTLGEILSGGSSLSRGGGVDSLSSQEEGGKCINPSCGEVNYCTKKCYKCGGTLKRSKETKKAA